VTPVPVEAITAAAGAGFGKPSSSIYFRMSLRNSVRRSAWLAINAVALFAASESGASLQPTEAEARILQLL